MDPELLLEDSDEASFSNYANPNVATGLRHRKHSNSGFTSPAVTSSKNPIVRVPVFDWNQTAVADASAAALEILEGDQVPSNENTYTSSLIAGLRPSIHSSTHHAAVTTIDIHMRGFALWVICVYIALVMAVYAVVPEENIVRLSGIEQRGAVMAMSLIAVSFLSRIVPLVNGAPHQNHQSTKLSGIFIGGLTVQLVAFCTDFIMANFPVPVVIDPVLGSRVHLLRWCEWAPCATFMTFMMEGADLYWEGDMPPTDFMRTKYIHSATQGGAVFLGLMFPFCSSQKTWAAAMFAACCFYLTNFPRIWNRMKAIPSSLSGGATMEEAERFNAAKIALRLRSVCILVWSIIVMLYFVSSYFGPRFSSEGSLLKSPEATMICECFFDVLSKVLFLVTIVDVHYAVFDPFARTERRLEELRQLMSAVWENSSDVIAISVRTGHNGGATTMLSPAFFGMGSGGGPMRRLSIDQIKNMFRKKSVLFQLSSRAFDVDLEEIVKDDNIIEGEAERRESKIKTEMISNVQCTDFSMSDPTREGVSFHETTYKPETGSLRAVAEVVVKAWKCKDQEVVLSHDLHWIRDRDNSQFSIRSEAKVSRLDENAMIVIVRDISERVKVFEAEKKVLFETTSRLKDAEANRFTRHEVKNGLLAAIGLYETLCDAQRSQLTSVQRSIARPSSMTKLASLGIDAEAEISENVVRCMNELGKSLNDTLETIMVEAMARDLVHDLYRPNKERIDLASVLSGTVDDVAAVSNLTRFPMITRPSPLPMFYFDPQLLRYLHRQALSNACKYGKIGGSVLTEITFDDKHNTLEINVINMPGQYHDRLVAMGPKAEERVFFKGYQIHDRFMNDMDSILTKKTESTQLPGDGGWVMQKMARMMKGECKIKFLESKTVFTLSISAKPYESEKIRTPTDVKTFRLPPEIWGIGIDDSRIQQKLLAKFFEFTGISSEKIKVFGKDSEEIMGFVDFVVNFMNEHMGSQILLIADENLEMTDGASNHITVSGSALVESIRSRLLPEQERDLIALIRSANDSASDVAVYRARAHGFLPKAPIKKANVLETLAPLWLARYPPRSEFADDMSQSRFTRSDSLSSLESSASLNEAIAATPVEVIQMVDLIDAIFRAGDVVSNWDAVWEKMHALKGDLLTLQVGSKVIAAVGMINSFRELHTNEELIDRWNILRDRIKSLASST